MPAFPGEGFRDLSMRLRILWLWLSRLRLRRTLSKAEAELGWLGWERADFQDDHINAQVAKVREFENAQASLLNASAELSGRKALLDQELAGEKKLHDETQASLARERVTAAAKLEEVEAKRRQRLGAAENFERAIGEIARNEKQLEARSVSFMSIEHPGIEVRNQAREVSDELIRLAAERKLVLADKAAAGEEASRLEPEIARLRAELQRIDSAASDAREQFAAAGRRLGAGMRQLEREREKSNVHMSRLDREKRRPYRVIGACLADHEIAPLNQPEILEKVLALRSGEKEIGKAISDLRARCATTREANAGMLIAFYLVIAVILLAGAAFVTAFRHP